MDRWIVIFLPGSQGIDAHRPGEGMRRPATLGISVCARAVE
jgi:hypothetical protein